MKEFILFILIAVFCTSIYNYADLGGSCFLPTNESVQNSIYGEIDAKGLKSIIDARVPFTLLDARGNNWNDNNIIPGAKMASHKSEEEELESNIPDKDSLVVVYCYSSTCPLANKLALKLIEAGYTNIIVYPAGLTEWRDSAGYPVDEITRD
ncbi:MAG TPA: rhodanese-like domain-containing protein [Parachlamydiaceae bacterium]|nr:rhodanese-like domain-containing protein [Parachlamydiaceae bacterium]